MKKIMIIAAAALMAGLCSASTVKWNVTNIYKTNDAGQGLTASTDKAAAGTYYVMCFLGSELSLADATAMLKADNLSGLAAKATFQGTTTGNGIFASSYYDGGWNGGDTVDIYTIVLNANTVAGATYGVVSSAVSSYTYADAAEDKMIAHSMKTATQGTWTAVNVPEPTSGLLLLLGMAGLALRRKQA